MDIFPMSVANNFCDMPLPKYLDSKAVLIYRPHPVRTICIDLFLTFLAYLAKAGLLAEKFGSLHGEEMRAREVFEDKLSKHFLSTMFRGMGDYPPPFATEKPRVFDDKLPKISLQVP